MINQTISRDSRYSDAIFSSKKNELAGLQRAHSNAEMDLLSFQINISDTQFDWSKNNWKDLNALYDKIKKTNKLIKELYWSKLKDDYNAIFGEDNEIIESKKIAFKSLAMVPFENQIKESEIKLLKFKDEYGMLPKAIDLVVVPLIKAVSPIIIGKLSSKIKEKSFRIWHGKAQKLLSALKKWEKEIDKENELHGKLIKLIKELDTAIKSNKKTAFYYSVRVYVKEFENAKVSTISGEDALKLLNNFVKKKIKESITKKSLLKSLKDWKAKELDKNGTSKDKLEIFNDSLKEIEKYVATKDELGLLTFNHYANKIFIDFKDVYSLSMRGKTVLRNLKPYVDLYVKS